MRKRFREGIFKFYDGGAVNAKTNAGFGFIAKVLTENFGVKIEDLTLTQINAYFLEWVKAEKARKEAEKTHKSRFVSNETPLASLKKLGFKIGKKHGR